jgi:predicted  nucleic acid-binding Zn-ribbon protein
MKVSTVKICLNCDAVYEGEKLCPDCAGDSFVYLSKYFKPTDEERKVIIRTPIHRATHDFPIKINTKI